MNNAFHNFAGMDFRGCTVTDMGQHMTMIDWPAYAILISDNPEELTLMADNGGRHLGQAAPGIAVPFPTIRHGMMFKFFGICFDDDGTPLAYGKSVSITAEAHAKEYLAGAMIGDRILIKDQAYRIEKAPNNNITFSPA
jgi:hypothetical protein